MFRSRSKSLWSLASLLALLSSFSLVAVGAAPPLRAPQAVTVYAAVSLSDALREIGDAARGERDLDVTYQFGASNDLARQIAAGAPADLFLSANREQIERLEASGQIAKGKAFPFLGNALVVIVPVASRTGKIGGAKDLLRFDRLALADPRGVPLGVYAQAWLQRKKVWRDLETKVLPTLDARAAVGAVAAGNAPVGIVYATDAAASRNVRIAYRIPLGETPDVRYWAAPLTDNAAPFVAFLRGPSARKIFERYGFFALGASRPSGPNRFGR